MMKGEILVYPILIFILLCNYTKSVPDEYCLTPLNQTDCGHPPTAVFAYYKPGSRCEIKMWRGCSTNNMFEDEVHCSHYCIGRNYLTSSETSGKEEFNKTINDLDIDELKRIDKVIDNAMNKTTPDSKTDSSIDDNFSKEKLIGGNKGQQQQHNRVSTQRDVTSDNDEEEDSKSVENMTRPPRPTRYKDDFEDYATILNVGNFWK